MLRQSSAQTRGASKNTEKVKKVTLANWLVCCLIVNLVILFVKFIEKINFGVFNLSINPTQV